MLIDLQSTPFDLSAILLKLTLFNLYYFYLERVIFLVLQPLKDKPVKLLIFNNLKLENFKPFKTAFLPFPNPLMLTNP